MITSLARYAVATATVVALSGLSVTVARRPARAAGFSADYTCAVPMLGSRTVTLDGWLTSPGQLAINGSGGFQLHISRLGLGAPVAIGSWTASAWIDVRGAEGTSFQVTGSGGFIPAGQPLSGDLTGDWAPAVSGTDLLSVSSITISVNTAAAGNVMAQCVPNEPRPVAETLTVLPPYSSGWAYPVAPPYHSGWGYPVAPPHHHGWGRPDDHHGSGRPDDHHGSGRPDDHHGSGRPDDHHGRGRPDGPHHGGWSRPGTPPPHHHG
jgi:hypothetical protein